MTNGIKISVPGYAVQTADDEHLSLKTDFTLLKVKMSGVVGSNNSYTIAHNLGYIPQFLVFWIGDPTMGSLEGACMQSQSYFSQFDADGLIAGADATNLYIDNPGLASSALYYIFYEQL